MSQLDAGAFLDRVEQDAELAAELAGLGVDPSTVQQRVDEGGFDVWVDEIRQAFVDRHSAELTSEHLDAIAAGADLTWGQIVTISVGSGRPCHRGRRRRQCSRVTRRCRR